MKLKVLSVAIAASMVSFACADRSDMAEPEVSGADATGGSTLGPDMVEAPDGTQIPESVFRYYSLNAFQKPADELTEQEREAVLDSLVSLDLLAEAAEERGLPQERTVAVELELQRQQVLARTMINRYIEENPPSEEELQAEYEANLPELASTEHRARHILLESEEEANAVIEDLNEGADFAALAEERSTDPSAESNGGDLGWFTADTMVPPFADAVAEMEVGTYSAEPVETQFGWHVILLEERRDSEPPGLASVREQLSNQITQRKIEAYIDSLRQ